MKHSYTITVVLTVILSLLSCKSTLEYAETDKEDSPSFALKRKVASMLRHDSISDALQLAREGLKKYPEDLQLTLVEGFLLKQQGNKAEAEKVLKRCFAAPSSKQSKNKNTKKKYSLTDDICRVLCIKLCDDKGYQFTSNIDHILMKYDNSKDATMPIVANVVRSLTVRDIEKSMLFTGSWLYLSDDECLSPVLQHERLKWVLSHEAPQAYRDDMNQFKYFVNEKGKYLYQLYAHLCPDNPLIPFSEGVCLYSQKDYRGAQACWKKSLDIFEGKPDSLDYVVNRALCLLCLQGKRAYQEELDRIESSEAYKQEWEAKNPGADLAQYVTPLREITLSTLVRSICWKDEQGNPIEPENVETYNF